MCSQRWSYDWTLGWSTLQRPLGIHWAQILWQVSPIQRPFDSQFGVLDNRSSSLGRQELPSDLVYLQAIQKGVACGMQLCRWPGRLVCRKQLKMGWWPQWCKEELSGCSVVLIWCHETPWRVLGLRWSNISVNGQKRHWLHSASSNSHQRRGDYFGRKRYTEGWRFENSESEPHCQERRHSILPSWCFCHYSPVWQQDRLVQPLGSNIEQAFQRKNWAIQERNQQVCENEGLRSYANVDQSVNFHK